METREFIDVLQWRDAFSTIRGDTVYVFANISVYYNKNLYTGAGSFSFYIPDLKNDNIIISGKVFRKDLIANLDLSNNRLREVKQVLENFPCLRFYVVNKNP